MRCDGRARSVRWSGSSGTRGSLGAGAGSRRRGTKGVEQRGPYSCTTRACSVLAAAVRRRERLVESRAATRSDRTQRSRRAQGLPRQGCASAYEVMSSLSVQARATAAECVTGRRMAAAGTAQAADLGTPVPLARAPELLKSHRSDALSNRARHRSALIASRRRRPLPPRPHHPHRPADPCDSPSPTRLSCHPERPSTRRQDATTPARPPSAPQPPQRHPPRDPHRLAHLRSRPARSSEQGGAGQGVQGADPRRLHQGARRDQGVARRGRPRHEPRHARLARLQRVGCVPLCFSLRSSLISQSS